MTPFNRAVTCVLLAAATVLLTIVVGKYLMVTGYILHVVTILFVTACIGILARIYYIVWQHRDTWR